jgi:organic radical activating enzyme
MSRYSGDKVRFTLDVEADQSPQPRVGVQYGTIPELVDMKITGFCPFSKDCPWCYMDSDAAGQHASQEDVARIMDECRRVGVFEIALGGGEPTLWPHLPWLAGYAKDAGINLNLTSKNFAWFSQAASEQTLKELSAVAFSVNNQRDLDRMKDLWTNEGPAGRGRLRTRMIWSVEGDAPEATVQCVPALLDDALIGQIVEFCREADIRVTFLGLKRTGRAQEHTQTDDLRWISALEGAEPRWLRYGVAVDTLMAAAASDAFQEAQISPAFYGVQEGAFSCYVDATTGRLGTSSYVPDSEMVPFTDSLPAAFVSAQIVSGVRPA